MSTSQAVLRFCKQSGQTLHEYIALDTLAFAQSHKGEHEAALRSRAEAVAVRKPLGGTITEDWFDAMGTELLLNAGRTEDALAQALPMAAASKQAGMLLSYPIAERVIGCALARTGADLAEVEAHFSAGLLVCAETGYVGEMIRTQLAWGQICRERGDEAAAQSHFAPALQRLEAGGSLSGLNWARRIVQAR